MTEGRRWTITREETLLRFKNVLDGPPLLYGEQIEVMPVREHEQFVARERREMQAHVDDARRKLHYEQENGWRSLRARATILGEGGER